MSETAASKPILTAFRSRSSAAEARNAEAGRLTRFFVSALGCLLVIGVCAYLHRLEPVAKISSVEFTHADVVVMPLVLVVVLSSLIKGVKPIPKRLVKATLLFFVATIISAITAFDLLRASAAVAQIVEFALLAWAVSLLERKEDILRVVHFVIGVMIFQSILAAFQFAIGDVPVGVFLTNQQYAMFTGFAAAMTFGFFIAERNSSKRLGYGIALLVLVMGCVLGQERAPWVAFFLAACGTIYYYGRNRVRPLIWLLITVSVGVSFVVAIPGLQEKTSKRIMSVQSQDVSQNTFISRLALWTVALKLFSEHPVLGVGPKNFVTLVPNYLTFDEQGGYDALDPHNVWLGVLAEQGIVGFATYIYFIVAVVSVVTPILKCKPDPDLKPLLLALLAYQLFWIIMSLHYFTKGEGHIHFLMLGLMIGLNRHILRTAKNVSNVSNPSRVLLRTKNYGL